MNLSNKFCGSFGETKEWTKDFSRIPGEIFEQIRGRFSENNL